MWPITSRSIRRVGAYGWSRKGGSLLRTTLNISEKEARSQQVQIYILLILKCAGNQLFSMSCNAGNVYTYDFNFLGMAHTKKQSSIPKRAYQPLNWMDNQPQICFPKDVIVVSFRWKILISHKMFFSLQFIHFF